MVFTVDASTGVTPDGSTPEGGSYNGVVGLGNTPAAVQCIGAPSIGCANPPPCTAPKDCQFDFHCDVPSGKCVQNLPGDFTACGGVNLTAGLSCSNGGNIQTPVCNRGDVALPSGTLLHAGIIDSAQNAAVATILVDTTTACAKPPPPAIGQCDYTTTSALAPGQCVTVDWSQNASCTPGNFQFSNGGWVVINSAKTVAECGEPALPGCSDNWSYYQQPGSPCSPILPPTTYPVQTFTQPYVATCPAGSKTQWGYFAFKGTTPCSPGACSSGNPNKHSSIKIEVQSRQGLGPPSPAVPVQIANASTPVFAPFTHPSNCPMSGPSPCPIDVYSALGGKPAAQYNTLLVTFTLNPSADKLAAPTLNSWEVTYSCVPNE
jgi:hypothetical protein